jgi:hypothetical protein
VFAAVGVAVYHGHDGLRNYLRELEDAWGTAFRIEPDAYFDLGERTLALHLCTARAECCDCEQSRNRVLAWCRRARRRSVMSV